jgi:hypothetical protein
MLTPEVKTEDIKELKYVVKPALWVENLTKDKRHKVKITIRLVNLSTKTEIIR